MDKLRIIIGNFHSWGLSVTQWITASRVGIIDNHFQREKKQKKKKYPGELFLHGWIQSGERKHNSRVSRWTRRDKQAVCHPLSFLPFPHSPQRSVHLQKIRVYTHSRERLTLENFTLKWIHTEQRWLNRILSRIYFQSSIFWLCVCFFFFFLKSNNGRFRSNNLFISLRSDRSDLEPSVQDPTHLISRAREPNSSLFFLSSLSLFLSLSLPFLSNAKPRTKISIQDPSSFLTGVSRTEIT